MAADSMRKTFGQLFAVGFHGTELDESITSLIRDYGVGAIVLFKRNVRDAAQLQAMCLQMQNLAKDSGHSQPLFIGIDQENGLVTRISPPVAAQMPGPMTLGATGSLSDTYEVAKTTANMLRYFGINMNYAPVGDINSEPLNPVIGVRSPGDDPKLTAQNASECARGMRETKVVPCIKHFPGHGDTAVDSHYGLPVIDKSREDMEKTELVPFRHAAQENIEMIMTAHISLPQLTGSDRPATLSPEIMEILRKDLEYDGVVMTDCLEMDGVRAKYGTVEGSLMAFKAGVDNVMICHTYEVQAGAIDRLCTAVETGEVTKERIQQSLNRLSQLKSRFIDWETALHVEPPETLEKLNLEGEKLAKRVFSDAATLVRSRPGLVPLPRDAKTVFVSPGQKIPKGGAVDSGDVPQPTRVPWVSSSFGDKLRKYNPGVTDLRFTEDGLTEDQWKQVEEAQIVVFATRNALESKYQRDLGLELARRRGASPVVAVATCAPYDFLKDDIFDTYLAVYEPTVEAFASAVDIMYGADASRGKLPVAH